MGKVEERRADLRTRLIELAEIQIAQGGIAGLKARDLAQDAGCALGAIYNVFDDMNALVMAVNGRTFQRIGVKVGGAVQGQEGAPPVQRLVLLANAYLAFAAENHLLWRTLFDLDMSDDGRVPDWYMAELRTLFSHIAKPVAELYPTLPSRDLELMVRALFSSVHGMVLLGLQNRISGVPRENIHQMIAQILGLLSPQ